MLCSRWLKCCSLIITQRIYCSALSCHLTRYCGYVTFQQTNPFPNNCNTHNIGLTQCKVMSESSDWSKITESTPLGWSFNRTIHFDKLSNRINDRKIIEAFVRLVALPPPQSVQWSNGGCFLDIIAQGGILRVSGNELSTRSLPRER